MTFTREFYIPKASRKVADKASDAVAYAYERDGKLYAAIFYGKQAKPVSHYRYRSEAERERAVCQAFDHRRQHASRRKERRAERSKPHKLEVGHILNTCWGYEQTNREFFEITKIVSPTMVELREVAQVRDTTGWEQGRCFPKAGEPIRRRASTNGSVKICKVRYASIWSGQPVHWTSYH